MKQILVVSDFHISEGFNSLLEDFFYETEFIDLLKKYSKDTELVINGDFVDFLQITYVPEQFKSEATESELRYGLKTSPEKSAWKIKYVMNKHENLFKALAEFTQKNNVYHLKGNHDVEFYWPEVQNTFHEEMKKLNQNYNESNFKFLDWFYYKPELVWIEHGNQYDSSNSFCNLLHPVLPDKKEIELPFGSCFCRYVFNELEKYDTFADNIKPVGKYWFWALKNKPKLALKFLLAYFPLAKNIVDKSRLTMYDNKQKEQTTRLHEKKLKKLSAEVKIPYNKLQEIEKLRVPQLLEGKRFFLALIKGQLSEEANLNKAAKKIKEILNVKYVVFGHTHLAEQNENFLNTGTWTPIVKEGKIENISTSKKLTYVLIKNGEAKVKEWK
ncbi:metallophosphoesterase [archaeon]|nr:metallophosphoesterase [archaeon]